MGTAPAWPCTTESDIQSRLKALQHCCSTALGAAWPCTATGSTARALQKPCSTAAALPCMGSIHILLQQHAQRSEDPQALLQQEPAWSSSPDLNRHCCTWLCTADRNSHSEQSRGPLNCCSIVSIGNMPHASGKEHVGHTAADVMVGKPDWPACPAKPKTPYLFLGGNNQHTARLQQLIGRGLQAAKQGQWSM